MLRCVLPSGGRAIFACAILLAVAAGAATAKAEAITWERAGPFQACLAAGLEKWLDTQVDILTNEDPASWRIDDESVARWTVEALDSCKTKAGSGDDAAEVRFTKYMAQWRRHIHDLVERVRQQVKPD